MLDMNSPRHTQIIFAASLSAAAMFAAGCGTTEAVNTTVSSAQYAQAEGITEQFVQTFVRYADASTAERGGGTPTQEDIDNAIAELDAEGGLGFTVTERGTDKNPGAALSWSNDTTTCTARVGVDTGRFAVVEAVSCTP